MIYITGDTHRDFSRLFKLEEIEDDMLIILGDAGINYCLNDEDIRYKEYLKRFKIKLFCIRGNHEERPENINSYKEVEMFGGKVFIEDDYPNLIFVIYTIIIVTMSNKNLEENFYNSTTYIFSIIYLMISLFLCFKNRIFYVLPNYFYVVYSVLTILYILLAISLRFYKNKLLNKEK